YISSARERNRKGSHMATTTLPRPETSSRGRWLIGGIALIVLAIVVALLISGAQRGGASTAATTVPVTRGNIVAAVSGSGNVAAADIASAEAQLRSAQAKLDALKNPTPDKLSAAQLKLTQAQISLQKTRDTDSATKTRAEQDMLKAADALTQAQASYATAKS